MWGWDGESEVGKEVGDEKGFEVGRLEVDLWREKIGMRGSVKGADV